jgi:N6-adenosine-specific RNA methylase IME4
LEVQIQNSWILLGKTKQEIGGFFTGLGYYTRANPEQCLLATRGKGLKRKARNVPRLIVAPRGRHSEKPVEAYRRIERLFGNVSRVELFARCRRAGWDAFGNQVEGSMGPPSPRKGHG